MVSVTRVAESLLITGVAVAAAYAVYHLFSRLGRRAEGTGTRLDNLLISAAARPLAILVAALGTFYAVNRIPGAAELLAEYGNVQSAVLILVGSWIVATFSHGFLKTYGVRLAESTEGDFDDRLVSLGDMLLRYAVLLVGVMMALNALGISITPLIASMGIAGLAVAMAAKDIVSNMFGGVVMTVDRPFGPGDRVEVEGVYGDVIEVGPRSTRIRTLDNLLVTIPNQKLMNSVLTNYALPDARARVRMPIGVAYGSDLDRVTELCVEAMEGCDAFLDDPAPRVFVDEFADSAINLLMQAWTGDFAVSRRAKDQVYRTVYRRFDEEGIEIPYPQLDVGFRDDDPRKEE